MNEIEKRNAGLWYDANYDPDLLKMRLQCEALTFAFNQTSPADPARQQELLCRLLPHWDPSGTILPPFYTDYGSNCFIGKRTFINHGAYLMDGAPITIGDDCFIGPFCGFYTAAHPLLEAERNAGLEKASPVRLGNSIWLGASVIVLPGVTIGDGAVIGAGSVVTKDIPAGVVAAGNPCRVIRALTPNDSIVYEDASRS